MNVLGISGSPREQGNSHILLERSLVPFVEADWEAQVLRLRELTVKPCLACDFCRTHPSTCRLEADMGMLLGAGCLTRAARPDALRAQLIHQASASCMR